MGKHIDKETKYNYVMRYLNGESPTKLGLEINNNVKSPRNIVLRWKRKFIIEGIGGLESKTGKGKSERPKKKKKIDPSKLTPEEKDRWINIMQDVIEEYEDFFKKKGRARIIYNIVLKISRKRKYPVKLICEFLNVSTSGYYKWIKDPKTDGNYNAYWLEVIKNEYHINNGNYGAERIWASLRTKGILNVNIKTIKRYMRFLGLKAKIRVPKKRREIKDTSRLGVNYIQGNFKDDSSRAKLFTDTTQYNSSNGPLYFSAVIDANSDLLDLKVSKRNDERLIANNISVSVKKVGKKYILHSDNAAFYKNSNMTKLVSNTKGINSYSKPGNSLDNRPIEYFFSILKNEYLRIYKPENLSDAESLCKEIIFHYNHIRIQKQLEWKTPAVARVK